MTRLSRRMAWALVLLALATTSLYASGLVRDTLWHVEQTCIFNKQTTGASFPCLDVDLTQGFAILRAPLRQTHIVLMPTVRTAGVEAPRLRQPGTPNYIEEAWEARRYVQGEVSRPLAWNEFGLAINSALTRSQDQLHIHVDCVRPPVRRALSENLASFPTDGWKPAAFTFQHQAYWGRRVTAQSLAGVNLFALADEIPALRAVPALTILAVIGVTDPDGQNGFLLLAGASDPHHSGGQSTSEDLLDHSCGQPRF